MPNLSLLFFSWRVGWRVIRNGTAQTVKGIVGPIIMALLNFGCCAGCGTGLQAEACMLPLPSQSICNSQEGY
jgi:hypothetical protein